MASETAVVEMSSPEDQSRASKLFQRWINRSFLFSLIGALEAAVVVLGMLVTCLLGSAISHDHPSTNVYWTIAGHSFYAFLFLVGFWCFMTSLIIFFTSLTSLGTSEYLPKTTFFVGYHITASAFYLFGTMALLVETGKHDTLMVQSDIDVKGLVLGGGSFGAIVTGIYITLSVFAVRRFRQS